MRESRAETMATDCGCHVVSVRVQHGTGVDMLEVAHCPLHKAAGKLLTSCKDMMRFVKRWGPENKDPWEDILDQARAAIKEAKL